jgi:hypothetical protein
MAPRLCPAAADISNCIMSSDGLSTCVERYVNTEQQAGCALQQQHDTSSAGQGSSRREGAIYEQSTAGTKGICVEHRYCRQVCRAVHKQSITSEQHARGRNGCCHCIQEIHSPSSSTTCLLCWRSRKALAAAIWSTSCRQKQQQQQQQHL